MTFFKRFFNDADLKDRFSEDEGQGKYHGTVAPYPNFDPNNDASVLESAIEARGVDEDVIISVLVKRSNEQRQKIKAAYKASTGKCLEKELKSALKGDLEDVALALLMTPAEFDAFCIREATKRLGTDEDVLVEILATRSRAEIQEISRVFKQEYRHELEEVLKKEAKGDFEKALLALYKSSRSTSKAVDMQLAKKDAETLFESGENRRGTDVDTFIEILTTRSKAQLAKTFQEYAAVSDRCLPKALKCELRGDIEDCLIDIVKVCWNTPAFFAEKLHEAMKGHGTCEKSLIRVLVSRSEVDLRKIVEEYYSMYDRHLQEDIMKDTRGHYEKVLLGVCGPK
ncbi:annexin A1-like [Boleophthalmus pectinirostris]|uniref:annexin A1-like n=1 Tax=Boleophthalmus pectinirostris TaxID=150288 RepID=UPI000A1C2FE0|nr:annexin A1-like [Boleophthalmus pectinirostris]